MRGRECVQKRKRDRERYIEKGGGDKKTKKHVTDIKLKSTGMDPRSYSSFTTKIH